MSKIIRKLLVSLALIACLIVNSSCLSSSNYESGEKIVLSTSNYNQFIEVQAAQVDYSDINIKSFLTSGLIGVIYDSFIQKDDSIMGIAFDYKCTGYDDYSYFSANIVIKVSMEILQDDGLYHQIEFTETISLDNNGDGRVTDTYTFSSPSRNIKNIVWKVASIEGYVVKK